MLLPEDLREALKAGDPMAEMFVRRLVDAAGEACVDRQLEEDWDDAARCRSYDGHDDE
jgi:hypothetical protein